jgi:hypothetical protein
LPPREMLAYAGRISISSRRTRCIWLMRREMMRARGRQSNIDKIIKNYILRFLGGGRADAKGKSRTASFVQ